MEEVRVDGIPPGGESADAIQVIEMRLQSIALGKGTSDEMFLMVTEKLDAMAEARAIILRVRRPLHHH